MQRRLPPLNALRAFEAAARHQSFTKAAGELGVTQTAVSRHVRLLEHWIGVGLFIRDRNALRLTVQGERLLATLSPAFNLVADAVGELMGQASRRVLKISTQPNFAIRWLIPRLSTFRAQHPSIDVHLSTNARATDFPTDGSDLAIRLGNRWPGVIADRLFDADLFPVCSPRLANGPVPLRAPSDLARFTLLHVSTSPQDWKIWLDAAGCPDFDWRAGPRFDSYALALQAAVEDLGVAIGRRIFVEDDLQAGRLVQPFKLCVAVDEAWHLIYPQAATMRLEVRAFRDWLLETAHRNGGERRRD